MPGVHFSCFLLLLFRVQLCLKGSCFLGKLLVAHLLRCLTNILFWQSLVFSLAPWPLPDRVCFNLLVTGVFGIPCWCTVGQQCRTGHCVSPYVVLVETAPEGFLQVSSLLRHCREGRLGATQPWCTLRTWVRLQHCEGLFFPWVPHLSPVWTCLPA